MVRQIARPSPVPPFWRASVSSTCLNRSKTLSSLSTGMPRPLSEMEEERSASLRCGLREAVGRGELDSVGEQVGQDLEDAVRITVEEDGTHRQRA